MIKIDRDGKRLCDIQAELFEKSVSTQDMSSEVFVRRFMNSKIAIELDSKAFLDDSKTINDIFADLDLQYGKTTYGSLKYNKDIMYWVGYLYRYFCYTYDVSSKQAYKYLPLKYVASTFISSLYNISFKEIVVDNGYFTATINQLFTLRDLVKSASPDKTIEDIIRRGIILGYFGTIDRTGLRFKNYVPGTDLVIRSIEFRGPKPGEPWDDEPVNNENLWRKLRMYAKANQRAAAKAAEETPVDPTTQAIDDPFGAF